MRLGFLTPGLVAARVARRVSDMLQRPVVSYANGREIVITFGQEEAPALALRFAWTRTPRRTAQPFMEAKTRCGIVGGRVRTGIVTMWC